MKNRNLVIKAGTGFPTITQRMRQDYDRVLATDVPGQNWTADLITDYGNGTDAPIQKQIRCSCYAKDGKGNPTLRTSVSDPIEQGMMVYIPAAKAYYLIEATPQLAPNCYNVPVRKCNGRITLYTNAPEQVDHDGMLIQEGGKHEFVRNIPCIKEPNIRFVLLSSTPGSYADDDLRVTIPMTSAPFPFKQGICFDLDAFTYEVIGYETEGDTAQNQGIIRMTCRRKAGSYKEESTGGQHL